MWLPLIGEAAAAGYQVVAFDQRGYSPGARPEATESYGLDQLADDVVDVADAVGFERFHLVGHDWGGAVGWLLVMTQPERIDTWSALSTPHLTAFAEAVQSSPEQALHSSYVLLFRTPWLPEQLAAWGDLRMLRRFMWADHPPELVDEYVAVFSEPGAITAALDWYRAIRPDAMEGVEPRIALPVIQIWGNQDPAVMRTGFDGQRQYLGESAELIELDTGHWLMETATDEVVGSVMEHIDRVPGGGS